MVAIFLSYNDAAGSAGLIELFLEEGGSIFFLPDNPSTERIVLSPHMDKEHSYLCLEIRQRFALLRTFSGDRSCSIVGNDQSEFELPVSDAYHFFSFILRPGDDFLAPSGRWAIRWDDDGKISESMRPPPLPLVTDETEASNTPKDTLSEMLDELSGSPSRLSEETCSPSPSPTKEKEQSGPSADVDDQQLPSFEEPAATVESPEKADAMEADSERRDLPDQPESADEVDLAVESNSMSGPAPHVAGLGSVHGEEVDIQEVPTVDSIERSPGAVENSVSATDVTQTAENSEEGTKNPHESSDLITPSKLDELRGSKRKFNDTQDGDSDHGATDAESNITIDTEAADTVVVKRKSKRSYSSKDRSYIAKTPSKRTRRDPSSTPNTTPRNKPPSAGPPAKRRSDRPQGTPSIAGHESSTPVVIFSSATTVDQEKTTMRTFRNLGGKVTEAILDATILCVPSGTLKKTSKLVMAVALGIDIVTEQWIAETHRLGKFPAIQGYLPADRPSEQEWKITLKDALARGKVGLTHLLSGVKVFFTKKLRTDLGKLERDFSQIATRLGAESVERRLPSLKHVEKPPESRVLVIGARDDPQGSLVGQLGYTLFSKDILVMAALRGCLEKETRRNL
ncbi:hypothetical protein H2200_012330 [Cladophialophora chaetospira]|uniref:BRCT domain-containing protein n=1 Tax=Cladophialophora chaetospira TaxID=386627 RepID=A0AA39CCD0_9EURO|nr:hypothetical protein H2200_012330 [Cladophialophora chaetospira]